MDRQTVPAQRRDGHSFFYCPSTVIYTPLNHARAGVQAPCPVGERERFAIGRQEPPRRSTVCRRTSGSRPLHRRQRLGDRQSTIEAFSNHGLIEADVARPASEDLSFAIVRQVTICRRVRSLLDACRPVAIIRRIGAVIVAALQCVLRRRTSARVSDEGGESAAPVLAHCDAAPAVAREALRLGIEAALFRAVPDAILRKTSAAVLRSVKATFCATARDAAERAAVPQMFGCRKHDYATRTATLPYPIVPLWVANAPQCGQLAEGLICEICGHTFIVSHG